MAKYKASWRERESGSAGEEHCILSKVSGKAHWEGSIWAKPEAGEAGSLADLWGKNKWERAAGGVYEPEVREHQGSGLGSGAGELCKGRAGSYFLPNFYTLCIVIFGLDFDVILKYYLPWLLGFFGISRLMPSRALL